MEDEVGCRACEFGRLDEEMSDRMGVQITSCLLTKPGEANRLDPVEDIPDWCPLLNRGWTKKVGAGTGGNVRYLAEKVQDNTLISPVDMLRDAIQDIESGKLKCTRAIAVFLDDSEPGGYDYHWAMSNMRASGAVALLSTVISRFTNRLNGFEEA